MSEFSEGMVEAAQVILDTAFYVDFGESLRRPEFRTEVATKIASAVNGVAAAPDYRHEAERLADAAESLMERMDNFEMSRPAGAWLELVTALATYRAALHVGEV